MSDSSTTDFNQLPALAQAVRKRPGMYFGSVMPFAINHLIYEVVANAVDQYLAGSATMVKVYVDNDVITVSDDGAGLPFNRPAPEEACSSLAEYYFLVRHDYPTADHHAPHIHFVGGGLGLAVVNAAAEYVKVTSSNGEFVWQQNFGFGKALTGLTKATSDQFKGTQLEIKLAQDIFQGCKPDLFDLRKNLFELAHFYPGLVVEFQHERFVAPNGLLDLASIYYKNPPAAWTLAPAQKFFFTGKLNDIQIQVAAIGETDTETDYLSWVNGHASVLGGTHVKAMQSVFNTVDWQPRSVLIHVIMLDPMFAGPSKDKLVSKEVIDTIKSMLIKPLSEFS